MLLAVPTARAINTGSFVYKQGRYDPDNLQAEKRYSTNATYAATKLYNLMFTRARHWSDTGITINCFSSGFVATDFSHGQGGLLESCYRFIRLFAISPKKGAATLVCLASSDEAADANGACFEKGRERDAVDPATNVNKCEVLFDWSVPLTGFAPAI